MDRAAIIAAYEANETAARDLIPGRFLLPEDVATCMDLAAEQCGVPIEQVRDVLSAYWRMEGGG